MFSPTLHRRLLLVLIIAAPAVFAAATHAAEKPPATLPAGLHDRIVAEYLNGTWDELSKEMLAGAKEIGALPPAQKADVEYIRKSIAECRPAWWKPCKAGKKVRIHPVVWGHALNGFFDPDIKMNRIDLVNGVPTISVLWKAADMDNPARQGELEFTKGEQVDMELWTSLGSTETWVEIPFRLQMNMSETDNLAQSRYIEYRGNVAGAYYATPRARRLAIWTGISGWSHEYDKSRLVMAHRAVGVLFAEEALAHRETYPSIPRPEEPPLDGAESKMVWQLQEWIRYHEIPLAEDKAFRDALKAFAMTNDVKVRLSGKLALPNGQFMSLDPEADKPLAVQRDTWIKAQYSKAPGK